MSDENLFNAEQDTTNTVPPVVEDPAQLIHSEISDYLKGITNDLGEPKYKTYADAFKALKASQDHIKTLEKDNQELREAKVKATALEELTSALRPDKTPVETVDFSKDIPIHVEKALERIEAERAAKANRDAVVAAAVAAFGTEGADKEFYSRAAAVGLSVADVNALSAKSPKAVLDLLKIEPVKGAKPPIPTGVRTEGFQTPQPKDIPSAMKAKSSKELAAAWAASKQATYDRLGIKS